MYSLSQAIAGLLNSILHAAAVLNWMYYVFCNSGCVKLNFTYSCSLTVDVRLLPCDSASNPILRTLLVLDWIFFLSCHSRCAKLNFALTYSLRLNVFSFTWHVGLLNVFLTQICNLKLDLFGLSWHLQFKTGVFRLSFYFKCVRLNFSNVWSLRRMDSVSGTILGVLI